MIPLTYINKASIRDSPLLLQ